MHRPLSPYRHQKCTSGLRLTFLFCSSMPLLPFTTQVEVAQLPICHSSQAHEQHEVTVLWLFQVQSSVTQGERPDGQAFSSRQNSHSCQLGSTCSLSKSLTYHTRLLGDKYIRVFYTFLAMVFTVSTFPLSKAHYPWGQRLVSPNLSADIHHWLWPSGPVTFWKLEDALKVGWWGTSPFHLLEK